jgi:hypothetical protein
MLCGRYFLSFSQAMFAYCAICNRVEVCLADILATRRERGWLPSFILATCKPKGTQIMNLRMSSVILVRLQHALSRCYALAHLGIIVQDSSKGKMSSSGCLFSNPAKMVVRYVKDNAFLDLGLYNEGIVLCLASCRLSLLVDCFFLSQTRTRSINPIKASKETPYHVVLQKSFTTSLVVNNDLWKMLALSRVNLVDIRFERGIFRTLGPKHEFSKQLSLWKGCPSFQITPVVSTEKIRRYSDSV